VDSVCSSIMGETSLSVANRGVTSSVNRVSSGGAGLLERWKRIGEGIIVPPADIIVERQGGDNLWAKGQLIEVAVENRADGAEGREAIGEGARGGGLEAVFADGFGEAHDSQNGTVALLGVGPGIEDGLDEGGGFGADLGGPVEEA
jgi:hypothetical protein